MSTIIPFQFEAHAVRVQVDDASQPWFNANDVCAALELANPRDALAKHVDQDDVAKHDTIDALGRTQQVNHVNESGLYSLILGSTKDAAKRFKRWVTSEVLPAIRQTGGYGNPAPYLAPTQDSVSAILLIGQAITKVPGVNPGIAAAATLSCIEENTNLRTEALRRALPAAAESPGTLNATQLGARLNLSAKKTNQLLADNGFQFRNTRGEWELTVAGANWGEALPFARHGHSGYQILWHPAIVNQLCGVAPC